MVEGNEIVLNEGLLELMRCGREEVEKWNLLSIYSFSTCVVFDVINSSIPRFRLVDFSVMEMHCSMKLYPPAT